MKVSLFSPRRSKGDAGVLAADDVAAPKGPNTIRRAAHAFAREAIAVLCVATSLYATLALASYEADPMRSEVVGADWVGPVGSAFADIAVGLVGLAAWFVPIELFAFAMPLLGKDPPDGPVRDVLRLTDWVARFFGNVLVVTILASLIHITFPTALAFGAMPIGGHAGELVGEVMRSLFSTVGSYIIGGTTVALILVRRASFSFIEGTRRAVASASAFAVWLSEIFRKLRAAWSRAGDLEAKLEAPEVHPPVDEAIIAALADDLPGPETQRASSLPEPPPDPIPFATADVSVLLPPTPTPAAPTRSKRARAASPEPSPIAPLVEVADVPTPSPIAPAPRPRPRKAKAAEDGIVIVDTSSARATEKADKMVPAIGEGFRLPTPDFLEKPDGKISIPVNEEQLRATAQLLEKTLSDYGVSGRVEEIHPGPTVTTFEVSPAAGTKVSKVASLADDLALGLSRKVRIIAPIPGKNRIGFEIPNEKRGSVNLRELIEDRRFVEMSAPLPCVLGRDIVGAPYFADLSSMPHMIVAGATGAGKSVGLNVVLVSLLYRRTPEELRLLMIDPKVVELAPFDGIPHMLLPVVTDMKQASNALKWAVDEMERRYQLFANAGTKNITTYNGLMERVIRGEAKAPRGPAKVAAIQADGTEVEVAAAKDGSDVEPPTKLPYIVIVVDEFADLMMQQGKDVETSVARLAQKARAAGMHVILATQRPSVDVITGMIKANFPTRIAFRVAQKVDSRTILDEQGAEHLLGRGDMLVKMNGSNEMKRVQCPFISEEEAQKITDFLRLQGKPEYDENILKPRDEDGKEVADEDDESDPLYDQAVRIVGETRRCSTSWLQRKLGIGYNRAAKLVETMERRGLVGPANGAKDREVLISAL